MKENNQNKFYDVWIAFLLILVGVIVWVDALRLSPNAISHLSGPDIWLKIIGTLLIFLSVLLLAAEFFKNRTKQLKAEDDQHPLGKEIIAAMLITGVYGFFLLEYVGFIVATIIYLTIMPILFRGRNSNWKACAYYLSLSIGFSLSFWYLFYKVMNVQLPTGILVKIIA